MCFLCNTCADKGKEGDGQAVAEEGASEVRLSSATSFTDEHCQPRVPQGSHLNPPKFAQEPHPFSNTSLLRFSEQASDKSPQPHPPGGVGRMKVMEKLDSAVEEEGRRAEGGTYVESMGHTTQQPVFVSTLVAVLSRYTVHVCSVLSNLTVRQSVWFVCLNV